MSAFCLPLPSFRLPFRGKGNEDVDGGLARQKSTDSEDTLVSAATEKVAGKGGVLAFQDAEERLAKVRELMKEEKLDYYIVLSEDAHQNEDVAEADKRRQWISGFTGSSGQAIIGLDTAYLVTDSRYWAQANIQLDLSHWTLVTAGAPDSPYNYVAWLAAYTHSSRVGIDARTVALVTANALQTALAKTDSTLVFPEQNFVDIAWGNDRPPPSNEPVVIHGLEFTGREASEKLADVREWVREQGHAGLLESGLSNIAYVLNLRGDDVPYFPVFFSYLFIGLEQTILFVNPDQLGEEIKEYLSNLEITVHGYDDVWDFLRQHGWGDDKILISSSATYAIALALTESRYTSTFSIIESMKGVKNETEVKGFRRAYLRDGACFVQFFAWLEEVVAKGEKVTEWSAAQKLTEYRSKAENFRGLAYENISSTGPNAALPHYHPEKDTALPISTTTPYLNDSGGQYSDGTCDTTRTIHLGRRPSTEQSEAFTRVLQGHIAIDSAIFPRGTSGRQLDVLARRNMWQDGLNYGHGTGHGFGSYLAVHEGPHGFSSEVKLVPGHVITNEPGFYKTGHFGVRLESALVVQPVRTKHEFDGPVWLGFERLTCVPIQTKMVVKKLLSREEREWLKKHNRTCVERLEPLLRDDKRAVKWLRRQAKFPCGF
ncbi:Creatinase/aminopeptidase [Peniophora sp. CONT]|nr:Creatinase/aminopeptidase [Peniophora sp. CONT]